MTVLKHEIKRVTLSFPTPLLRELDNHLKNFALTNRGRWLIEAAREKLVQEKILLSEIQDEKDKEDREE